MERTYKLFKKYILPIIILSCIGLIFALFSLMYCYNDSIPTIVIDTIPLFSLAFFALAVVVAIIFSIQIKSLHIKRIKKSSSFSKFSTLLAAGLITALFLYNFIQFVQFEGSSGQISIFKILRLAVSIPFVAYLVVAVLPKKFKNKKIVIPTWVMPVTSVCAILWCIFSLLSIQFWSGLGALPTTNMFRLIHTFYLVFALLFFLCEIGFEIFSKGDRFYVLSAALLFIYTFVLSGGMMLGKFFNLTPRVNISDFEIFVAFALGIYALSKLIAIQHTIQYVMKRDKDDKNGHHHHHHHHRHHISSKKASEGVAKSDIPADIDI